jgi:aryl-alcohol dehydrogenase-like predicted oxidoreductase
MMIPPTGQLVLGTANLGTAGPREDAFGLLDAFVGLGGSIIDTAAVYNDWIPGEVRRAEGIIGEWLRRSRSKGLFICTKGGHPPIGRMDQSRLDPASITADVEDSLHRLGVERLDLFYLHRDDPRLPVETMLAVLRGLVDDGKISSVGLSNWKSERVAAARAAAIVPIASNQVLGNVLCRTMNPPADPTTVRLDRRALLDAEDAGTSLFLYSSQCGGYLTKRLEGNGAGRSEYRNSACDDVAHRLTAIAGSIGVDPTNLAVSFLLKFSPNVFPIIGSRTVAQLHQSMAALQLHPTSDQVAEIAKISCFLSWRSPAPDGTPFRPVIHPRTDDVDATTAVDHSVNIQTSVDRP